MTKTELVAKVVEKTEMSKKDSEKAVNAVLASIEEAMLSDRSEKVQLMGFGTFENRWREPREGRNPQTKEKIQIAGSYVPAFKPGKTLKEKIKATFPEK